MSTTACKLFRNLALLFVLNSTVLAIAQPPPLWQRVFSSTTDLPTQGQPLAESYRLATTDKGIILALRGAWPFLVKLDNTGQTAWIKNSLESVL